MPYTPITFDPYGLIKDASPSSIAELCALCTSKTAMVEDIICHCLISKFGSVQLGLTHYQMTMHQMQRVVSEAIRRNKMALPNFRLRWGQKPGETRWRECVLAITGPEADVEPPHRDALGDIFSRHHTDVEKVSKVTGLSAEYVTALTKGQGVMSKKIAQSMAGMFGIDSKFIIAAFFESARRSAKKDPAFEMYPSLVPPPKKSGQLRKDSVIKGVDFGNASDSIVQTLDGSFFKVTIQKIG